MYLGITLQTGKATAYLLSVVSARPASMRVPASITEILGISAFCFGFLIHQ